MFTFVKSTVSPFSVTVDDAPELSARHLANPHRDQRRRICSVGVDVDAME
jgi:hypothetical protein